MSIEIIITGKSGCGKTLLMEKISEFLSTMEINHRIIQEDLSKDFGKFKKMTNDGRRFPRACEMLRGEQIFLIERQQHNRGSNHRDSSPSMEYPFF